MTCNIEYLNFKSNRLIPFDQFVETVLYKPKIGYYTKKIPFGRTGDFITAPTISNLFSEIISIWIVSSWEELGKPRYFNFVELGPGDGSFAKVFVNTLKKFPNLFNSINIYLYEKSEFLRNIQKEKLKDSKIKWINNFDKINKGPVIFFGNEFFDAIPIKQFKKHKSFLLEKNYSLDRECRIREVFRKTSISNIKAIKSYKSLSKLDFIEFPKLGLKELKKITKKITELNKQKLEELISDTSNIGKNLSNIKSTKGDDDILTLAIELVRSGSSKEEIKNKTGLNDSEIETIYAYHKNVKN